MSSVKTFESSQTEAAESFMLNAPENAFGLPVQRSKQSRSKCDLRTIKIVFGIIASIMAIVATTLGIIRAVKKPEAEEITDPNCITGWSEHHFGSKRKCFKHIGKYRVDQARQMCADLGAVLPLPRSDRERTDLVDRLHSFDIKRSGKLQAIYIAS